MSRLRILILGPDCNPDQVSMPLVTYCHAAALAHLHDVTLVVRSPVEDAVRRAGAPFRAVEVIRQPWLEKIYAWALRRVFRFNYNNQVLTAFGYPFFLAFEWCAWNILRRRISAGEFDVVLRIYPMNVVFPSLFAFFLRKGPVPFVIGPLNGGLPFARGFRQAQEQKQLVSRFRSLYRLLPFGRSTYRYAAAILAASSQTCAEFATYREKVFFLQENGVSISLCSDSDPAPLPERKSILELIFVGSLIPCKACDLGLRAAAPLLRSQLAHFTIVGDGPERRRLEQLVTSLGVQEAVSFAGWVTHGEVLHRLRLADVLVFPSVRDFGGGVIFEALALGTVPVVVDFGGPGDIVRPEIGYKVPLTNEADVISRIQDVLMTLAEDRELLDVLKKRGISYARQCLTWDAKARSTTRVLNWVLGRGPKPDFPPPKPLYS